MHLDLSGLSWTLMEVELVAVSEERRSGGPRYGAVVRWFDGSAGTLGDLRLGDKLAAGSGQFFAR